MASIVDHERKLWLTFLWDIENYSYTWENRSNCLESLMFNVDSIESILWKLLLFRSVNSKEKECMTYNFFGCCNDRSNGIQVEWELITSTEDGTVLKSGKKPRQDFVSGLFMNCGVFEKQDVTITTKEAPIPSQDTLWIRCRMWRTDGKAATPKTVFARTALRVKKRTFLWDIKRFSSLTSGEKVDFVNDSESKHDVVTFAIGVNEEDYVCIYIRFLDKNLRILKFQSFITDTKGIKIDCGKYEIFPGEINKEGMCTLRLTKQHLLDSKNLYLKNDVLSLSCECSWCDGYAFNGIESIESGITSVGAQNHPVGVVGS
ncbi:TD and POZ domain-containing protein 5 [Nephila pilipes]|uniref:TD and POZ domain-containing protein 5 n=1 Tax=Nephila pilipes TaxID=299642 RepID=A0A8X6U2W2_NEPPI|nr:TD and POZ domain-containing protein 5 [Nephila pilipes]